ncbi:hypothetical protein C8R44DRAFT_894872 [Mycena epipterygia]|nr:hypothetical protein C8R44DRAFT_894872 [Mycena epipterygia]
MARYGDLNRRGLSLSLPRFSLRSLRPSPGHKTHPCVDFDQTLRPHSQTFSSENFDVVDAVGVHDIVLSGSPGSGKSTLAEAIVVANPDLRVLFIAPTRLLRTANLALASTPNRSDTTFSQLLTLVERCKQFGVGSRLFFVGNPRQALLSSLHGNVRGDWRYFEFAHSVFEREFKAFAFPSKFCTSRLDAECINNLFLLGEKGLPLTASHEGQRLLYIYGPMGDRINYLVDLIDRLATQYGADAVALLTPSSRNLQTIQLQKIVNRLTGLGHRAAHPQFDDMPLDPAVLHGKIANANYHQFPGIERAVAFVFGIESTYFDFFGRHLPRDAVPMPSFLYTCRLSPGLYPAYRAPGHVTIKFSPPTRCIDEQFLQQCRNIRSQAAAVSNALDHDFQLEVLQVDDEEGYWTGERWEPFTGSQLKNLDEAEM